MKKLFLKSLIVIGTLLSTLYAIDNIYIMDKKMQIESSEILRSFQKEGVVANGTYL